MQKKINVLVFPCGAENGIEIHSALKDVVNIQLFGASGKEDHGLLIYKNYFGNIPYIHDSTFIDTFNHILQANDIDIVIPTHDDIALFLAQNSEMFSAKIAVPGINQALVCRSKKLTYSLFNDYSFCPVVYSNFSQVKNYPIFVKPDKGQGGQGAYILNDKEKFYNTSLDLILTEFLPGEESTVDCFSDKNGTLRFIGPRNRNRTLGGISVNSSTQSVSSEIENIANAINERLTMRGLWYFQIKKDKFGHYKLLEISVRTAGTMNLYRALGINFPLLTVYDLMGYDIEILKNDYNLTVDRALFNRYKSDLVYDKIYIDFDDTITRQGIVNHQVISFLYNAKNNGKEIILITKHLNSIDDSLDRLLIHKSLFAEVIHIQSSENKWEKITENEKSIFIDNAFNERYEVKKRLNIPVFDVDAISSLIDWRE